MKEYGQTLDLKDDPELIAQYKQHHQAVWPQVCTSLREVGILGMRIYLLGQRMFMVMQTVDDFNPERDFAHYLELDPKCQEWEDLMGKFQQPLPQAQPGEKWLYMDKVFDLDWHAEGH
jgi:L-rhamnose mutarotase